MSTTEQPSLADRFRDAEGWKSLWASEVSGIKLRDDVRELKSDNEFVGLQPGSFTQKVPEILQNRAFTGKLPSDPANFKIGIVGAGCAGLFTAMICEWLNKQFEGKDEGEKLHVDYEVLEAASDKRCGGRLYTYKFPVSKKSPKGKHDYYDVGAMRFPQIPIMSRTFSLFEDVGLGSIDEGKNRGKLITYYLRDELKKCPTYFNDLQHVGPVSKGDPYQVNAHLKEDDPRRVPTHLMEAGPDETISGAIKGFQQKLKDFIEKGDHKGLDYLWAADDLSTRQFLSLPTAEGTKPIPGKGYSFNTVEWLETFEYATGWYDESLAETVLEAMDFDYPLGDSGSETKKVDWWCLEGGTQQVATKMAEKLSKPIKYDTKVTKIASDKDYTMQVTVENSEGTSEVLPFFALFNSTTLAALRNMDTVDAHFSYGTKQAIRSLGYGASCKVGIKFRRPWWREEPYGITRGSLARTDLPLRVCVYPSYNLDDPIEEPAVLLCSYTWSQDAQRLGALISKKSPKHEDELKNMLIRDLALLHSPTGDVKARKELEKKLDELWLDHYAYDWYADRNACGAFAYFGPGQFSKMWPEIITPTGWLYLIGEAASTHHAWIVGALESATRAFYQMLYSLWEQSKSKYGEKGYEPYLRAAEMLDQKKNAPFGPLPTDVSKEVLQKQCALGFLQVQYEKQKQQERAKQKSENA